MSKKPTPKKRLSKDRGRNRHSVYLKGEIRRLKNFSSSPYAGPATKKDRSGKALKKITRVKA
ncbi:hypothetical protein A3A67_03900 [Candidatus Peribacteria bacterium RIFCSPLOWO2_01_FULL_51_18]|nr:MAG: hypothetical protein A3C52_01590 [Candidatus Peribacteria bacterium RIFCSPHIGHO2_02_FULL_51_15]OGJ66768.1 MAG: hypothetical protein A3A67_03900 [Candidatus Peribacteria bacterium RIFCSPLOWO2_01_FULL_51_18]OGJ67214.1 MAG: hypothetical protein A3J34_02340 [Candidatus Peribacteria bacterium RIFCSPLOWO2_02_FULL_51_10]